MSSYVVTGVSRGIGFEFMRQLSANPDNTFFGLVRDKASTEKKVAAELPGRSNIHILQADITDYDALKRARDYVSAKTGGSLDYLISNAALLGTWSAVGDLEELGNKDMALLTEDMEANFRANAVAPLHLFHLFGPLVEKGRAGARKLIAITTGLADVDSIAKWGLTQSAPYAMGKAALNAGVAMLGSVWAPRGVLIMGVSPGVVDTGFTPETEEGKQKLMAEGAKFMKAAPDWKGPITPEESVKAVLSVIEKASVENGDAGTFVSHFGNKQWL